MNVETQIEIQGTRPAIWAVISNIAGATEHISGIEEIEVLEQPDEGLVGFKWKETRVLFGKTATEVMWVTEAVEDDHYITRAESHGCIYHCALRISEHGDGCLLTMSHHTQPIGLIAKIVGTPMGFLLRGMMRKVLHKDLVDIKTVVEG